jgi:hypothetical protein
MAKMDRNSLAGKFLIALRAEHPDDSAEELFARFSVAARGNAALTRSIADEAFRGIVSDLYDEAANAAR